MKPKYYLLEVGDTIQAGDEFMPMVGEAWLPCQHLGITLTAADILPRRRPMPAQCWPEAIATTELRPSVGDDPPKPYVLAWWARSEGWKMTQRDDHRFTTGELTHWMEQPPRPIPLPPIDQAWLDAKIPHFSVKTPTEHWDSQGVFWAGWHAAKRANP